MSVINVPLRHPWDEVCIGEVADVIVGGTPSTSVPRYWGGNIRWMASGDVHQKRISDVPGRISQDGLDSSNAKIVEPAAVAIALAGQGKTRGTAGITLVALCTNQSVALLKPRTRRLDTAYLYHSLDFRYEELRGRSAGAGRAGLSKALIESIPIPVPEEHEQQKIAEVLDTVDRAIEQTEALIAKYQRIKTGLMQDLLTRGIDENGRLRDPATHKFKPSPLGSIPETWSVDDFHHACSKVSVGIATSTTKHFVEIGVPLVRNQNIKPTGITTDDLMFITEAFSERNASRKLRPNDILTVRTGYPGLSCLVTGRESGWQTFTTLISRPKHEEFYAPFLVLLLNSHICKNQIEALQAGGAQKNLNAGELSKLKILRIPLPEQKAIADVYSRIEYHSQNQLAGLDKLKRLKTGLMQDLLTGKVSVEPLLETQTAR